MARQDPESGDSSRTADQESRRGYMGARLAPWQVKLALDVMSLQLKTGLCVPDIAARLSISATHFSKAFRNSVGVAPGRWYQRERISKSLGLLRDGELSLAEIASECGYFDESHFITSFSRVMGTPPGRWRRRQRAGLPVADIPAAVPVTR